MYDLIIVGGGPAGLTAAVYAIHKRMETLVLTQDLGGKASYGFELAGTEGHELIAGRDLVDNFRARVEYLDFAYRLAETTKVESNNGHFRISTSDGDTYEARTVIIATGARTERLDVPGESMLLGRGVSYSVVSHAPMFLGRRVAVVGRGERVMRGVAELSLIADKVSFLNTEPLPESPLTKHILESPRVELLDGFTVKEIIGTSHVQALVVSREDDWQEIEVDGVFVELGLTPNSHMVADLVECTGDGYVKVDSENATSVPGLFAAGDVAESFVEQILIAVGMGATAALSAYEYLLAQGRLPAWTGKAPTKLTSV